MNPDIKDVFVVTVPSLSLIANLWMFTFMRRLERQKASDDKLKSLAETVAKNHADHSNRLIELETRSESAPSHDDIKRIHARIDEVTGALRELVGKSEAGNHTLNLIQEFLLNGGGRK